MVDDYSLAPSYHAIITKAIQEQLSDYKAHSATFGEDGVMIDGSEDITNGKIPDEDSAWWEAWRKRVRSEALYKLPNPPDPRTRKRRKVVKDEAVEQPNGVTGDVPMTVDDFEEDENLMHEEMRILVKVRCRFVLRVEQSADRRLFGPALTSHTAGHHRRLVQA